MKPNKKNFHWHHCHSFTPRMSRLGVCVCVWVNMCLFDTCQSIRFLLLFIAILCTQSLKFDERTKSKIRSWDSRQRWRPYERKRETETANNVKTEDLQDCGQKWQRKHNCFTQWISYVKPKCQQINGIYYLFLNIKSSGFCLQSEMSLLYVECWI